MEEQAYFIEKGASTKVSTAQHILNFSAEFLAFTSSPIFSKALR